MKKDYKFRLIIAIVWLLLIYASLPFGPDVINFFFKKLGYAFVKRSLVLFSVLAALLVYIPFIKKFRLRRLLPYIIMTAALVVACAINISLKIPALILHIPEYAVLGVLLYRAFIVKYIPIKTYILTAATAISAGIIDERIIQYLLPMRYYDFTDILLNTTGVVVGIILVFSYNLKLKTPA